jgi:hypothetical protein
MTHSVSSGLDPETLANVGLVPSQLGALTYQAMGGLSYQSSQRTSISTSVSYNWTRWDSPRRIEGSQLVLDQPPFDVDPLATFLDVDESQEETLPTTPESQDFIFDVVAGEGLQDPRVNYQSAGARIGLSHGLTDKTTTSFGAFYSRHLFDSTSYRDGPRYGGTASLSHRMSSIDSLSLSYSINKTAISESPDTAVHSLTGGWSRSLRRQMPRMSLNASAGASYYQAAGGSNNNASVIGNFGLSSQLTRSTAIGIRYSRSYRLALGFGRDFLSDYASANLTQTIASRIQVGIVAAYTLGRDPLEPDSRFTGERYRGSVSFQIARGFSAGASYQKWFTTRQISGSSSSLDSNLWAFFLGYTKTWP